MNKVNFMKTVQNISIYNCLFLLICLLFYSSCKKPDPPVIEVVIQEEPSCGINLKDQKLTVVSNLNSGEEGTQITPDSIFNINIESAQVRNKVLKVGRCHRIIGYGHVWSNTNGTPTIENDIVKDYGTNVNFGDEVNTLMIDLVPNTKYWVRSFVTIENEDSKEQKTLYNNFISDFTPGELSVKDSRDIFNIQADKASIVITINEITANVNIIKFGLVWSKDIKEPTLEVNSGFNMVAGSIEINQQFQTDLNELIPNTEYNVRAFYEFENIGILYTDIFELETVSLKPKLQSFILDDYSFYFSNDERNVWAYYEDNGYGSCDVEQTNDYQLSNTEAFPNWNLVYLHDCNTISLKSLWFGIEEKEGYLIPQCYNAIRNTSSSLVYNPLGNLATMRGCYSESQLNCSETTCYPHEFEFFYRYNGSENIDRITYNIKNKLSAEENDYTFLEVELFYEEDLINPLFENTSKFLISTYLEELSYWLRNGEPFFTALVLSKKIPTKASFTNQTTGQKLYTMELDAYDTSSIGNDIKELVYKLDSNNSYELNIFYSYH